MVIATQAEGFSEKDYCVMQRSCNTFTEAFASRLAFSLYSCLTSLVQVLIGKPTFHILVLLPNVHILLDKPSPRLGLLDHFPAAVHQQSRLGLVIILIAIVDSNDMMLIISTIILIALSDGNMTISTTLLLAWS